MRDDERRRVELLLIGCLVLGVLAALFARYVEARHGDTRASAAHLAG